MTDIYIDSSAASMPEAADYLRHLTDTGHAVNVLGDLPEALADIPSVAGSASLPDEPAIGSWLITVDPELCLERRPQMQTMLVGPRAAPSPRPAPRCDVVARDLASAVLDILKREAMG